MVASKTIGSAHAFRLGAYFWGIDSYYVDYLSHNHSESEIKTMWDSQDNIARIKHLTQLINFTNSMLEVDKIMEESN